MPTYFNWLSLEHESIESAMDFYFIPCGEELLALKASPMGVDCIPFDATTGEKQFWFITREQVHARLAMLFPNAEMRSDSFNKLEILNEFGMDPTDSNWFGNDPIKMYGLDPIDVLSSPDASVLTKRYAVRALLVIEMNRASINQVSICERSEISVLVSLLNSTDRLTVKYAISAVAYISSNPDNHAAICESDGINVLTSLLSSSDARTVENAAFIFANLSRNSAHHAVIHKLKAIKPLTSLLRATEELTTKHAAKVFVNLSLYPEYHAAICENDGINMLMSLLSSTNELTIENAVYVFANLSANPAHHAAIHEANVMNALISLLSSTNELTTQYATAVFAYLSPNPAYHATIADPRCLQSLKNLCVSSNQETHKLAEQALENLGDYFVNQQGIWDASTQCQISQFPSDFPLNRENLIVPVAKRLNHLDTPLATIAPHTRLFQQRRRPLSPNIDSNANSDRQVIPRIL